MKKEKQKQKNKPSSWLQNTLFGIILLVFGALFKFFPDPATTIIFIILGVLLFFVGVTDAIAANKYKDEDDDWRTPIVIGIASIIVSLLYIILYWMRIPNANSILIISFAVWGILRCLILLISIARGKIKRKGSILSALTTGVIGILVLVLRNHLEITTDILGYSMLGLGAVMTFIGLYKRADKREKDEREERDKAIEKKISEDVQEQQPTVIAQDQEKKDSYRPINQSDDQQINPQPTEETNSDPNTK